MTSHNPPDTSLAVFTADGGFSVDVRLDAETVWLTQKQLSNLFDVDVRTVNEHLNNIFDQNELDRGPTIRKFQIVRTEGKRRVSRDVQHYNLDAILSVGYRVNSKRGTQFRIWATGVLRDNLIKGYALNPPRIQQRGVSELQQAIDLLAGTLAAENLTTTEGRAVLDVIQGYARSWRLLLAYDEESLAALSPGHTRPKSLSVSQSRKAVAALKETLKATGTATNLFGLERGDQFDAIITGLGQEVFGQVLYPTVETRAAHLLYFIIKDHPFSDGNKRIGSFLFINYLAAHKLHNRIGDNTLVALALMTAQSAPDQKDLMIRLITHLIA